jgi:predicted Ser/Thr protein kinase
MFCDNCGVENRDDANFCHKCSQDFSHIRSAEIPVAVAEAPTVPSSVVDDRELIEKYGRSLGSRYELKEKIARGGMGLLFLAHDRQLGMDVAIKFLLDGLANDISAIMSLKREAKAAMKLAHPNIIRLYNFEETAGAKYLLMEYVEGESLASMASRRPNRCFTEAEVLRYIPQVCEALKYSHAEEVIHRDIKPSNILITSDHRVKLADFGIAFMSETDSSELGGGTPIYMSPEQLFGRPLDGRTDIYSLGITMYEMLAGAPPFRGKEVSLHHLHMIPKPIEGLSIWMNTVVLKCLRKEPEGRWQSAAELKAVLTGQQDIGVPMQGKYLPWWLRNEEDIKVAPAATTASPATDSEADPPQLSRAEVYKMSAPERSARVIDRVSKVEKNAGLGDYAPEREHARMPLGVLAGVIAGLVIAAVERTGRWPMNREALFQLSLLLYGGLIGAVVGIAHKKTLRGMFSFTLGIIGGAAATYMLTSGFDAPTFGPLKSSYREALYGAVIGGFLGIADGIYERSLGYLIGCLLWGAVGGAAGFVVFLGVHQLFAAIWVVPLDWIVLGSALGFFIHLCIGFVERPWKRR